MNIYIRPSILLLTLTTLSQSALANSGLEKVHFLTGCWQSDPNAGSVIRETFTRPQGGVILGNSQLVKDGETKFHEFIKITNKSGKLTYQPYPMGKKAKPFNLVASSKNNIKFESKENDFPKVINYQYVEATGSLIATIEGDDVSQKQSFTMNPVSCSSDVHTKAMNKISHSNISGR